MHSTSLVVQAHIISKGNPAEQSIPGPHGFQVGVQSPGLLPQDSQGNQLHERMHTDDEVRLVLVESLSHLLSTRRERRLSVWAHG